LRGYDCFDAGYQQPTYSRPRAGSAASGGSAGSRYDIDRKSPGLPPVPRPSKSRTIVEPEDQYRWNRKPSMRQREQEKRLSSPKLGIFALHPEAPQYTVRPSLSTTLSPEVETQRSAGPLRPTIVQEPRLIPRESPVPSTRNSDKVECDVCGLEVEVQRKRDWQ
jgi:hypothetical protein